MPRDLQGNTRHNLSWDKDRITEMVSGDHIDGKRKEKSIEPPTRTRFGLASESNMAYDDLYPSRDGKESVILEGIIEADETYIGGKNRKDYSREGGEPRKRGRGTAKDAVIGAVQRGGKVVAQLVSNVTGQTILDFIKRVVKTEDSELITDQYPGYNAIGKEMKHETLN